jgi:hypothetical protein
MAYRCVFDLILKYVANKALGSVETKPQNVFQIEK